MATDLRDFDGSFSNDEWPDVLCPVCRSGIARPEKDAISLHTTAISDRDRGHEGWEPEWIYGFFSGYLRCSDPKCNEVIVVSGDYGVGLSGNYNEYTDYLTLRSALPALPLCLYPDDTPETVRDQLERASAVVWVDPQSAANSLRRAVEALVDAQSIPRVGSDRKGNPRQVSLHERISLLAANATLAAEALEAVKWVGNEGSHAMSDMSATDCIDASEFLAFALKVLYDKRDEELLARVRTVNAAKGRAKPPASPGV